MTKKIELNSSFTPSSSVISGDPYRSPVRLLGTLKQPDSNLDLFELDESEVVWSSDASESGDVVTHSPPTASNSPTSGLRLHHHHRHHHHQQFHPKSGLSAALSQDSSPHVRRKSTLNPSLSAASAARKIPPVPSLRSDGSGGSPAAGRFPQSAPVNVPVWPKKAGERSGLGNLDEVEEDDVEEEEEEMVPPHVIVAKSHVMAFSVFEGVGRTLKGRDLRRVRDAVFQKTGFID